MAVYLCRQSVWRLAAFSGRNGLLVWEQRIGSIEMPWLAGKTLFVMGHDGRLCLRI